MSETVGSVKGVAECFRVNFYGDLNRSMRVSVFPSFSLFFSLCAD